MATIGTAGLTGNADIDGLLVGARWQGRVTYSFPSTKGAYPAVYGAGEPSDLSFGPISAAQQAVFQKAAGEIATFTNLSITYQPHASAADFLIAQSAIANPTAYTYVLGASDYGGDIWFGTAFNWRDPKPGDYFHYAHIHEFGHALGLKHGHETSGSFPLLPAEHDALEFTVMSYRSFPGASPTTGLTNETYGFPSTYMISDIRALQQLYGANFSARGGNTVYSWSPTTGETFIDGVGQGRPGGSHAGADANVIFMSVWDGGGQDTYDFSNYVKAVTVNLNPGAASTASKPQLALLGQGHYAAGNIYNASLYNGDVRSYIENAKGGRGNDYLLGNATDNQLDGGAGNDKLVGGLGADRFIFGTGYGRDTINDFKHGTDKIALTNIGGVDDFADLEAHGRQMGSHTVFTFGKDLTLTLRYTPLACLTADDFLFPHGQIITREGATAHAPVAAASPPSDIAIENLIVRENQPGASLGKILVTDPDGDSAFTITSNNADWIVEGNAGSYALRLKDGVSVDYEATPFIELGLTAKDAGGLSFSKVFLLTVANQDGATITGTPGADVIDAAHTVPGQPLPTSEEDVIRTAGGTDTVRGEAGNDDIDGGAGNDQLSGGDGNDLLKGGAGADALYGQGGNDAIALGEDDALGDMIRGGEGSDTIRVYGDSGLVLSQFDAKACEIETWHGNNFGVLGTEGNDTLDFSGLASSFLLPFVDGRAGDDLLIGTAAGDDLRGGAGNDTIYGRDGVDNIRGGAGADKLDGGAGSDVFWIAGSEGLTDQYSGGDGTDTLANYGGGPLTLSHFSAKAASIEGLLTQSRTVLGTDGIDKLDFSGLTFSDVVTIEGGDGNDVLTGYRGGEIIRGGNGFDEINGGGGNDFLTGGTGGDRFVFDAGFGQDIVYDFEEGAGQDVIAISKTVFADFSALIAASHQQLNAVVIEGGGGRIDLQNTQLDNLQAGDFYFF